MSEGKLIAIKFGVDERRLPEALGALDRELRGGFALERDERALAVTVRRLRAYLDGRRAELGLPFDVSWVPGFRRGVLLEVARVPRGAVASYGEIARRAGRPNAFRAVGNAMRTNPIPLVIPCHRIVASGGRIGGFGGGLEMKRRLLRLEGAAGWTEAPV
ncbi:MAG: methylated-DNA--[protein]-cysteine S-methyltransferase [Dehalococcoidia bacterium]|nr:methylated-DNA--[protein]-cysteine S-methyltransferase [Dehalococcoidia bacterium]